MRPSPHPRLALGVLGCDASGSVAIGTSVTWPNSDTAAHSPENGGQRAPARFDTGRLDNGDRKSIRFDKPGVYTYHCVYHRFMEAMVMVVK